MPSTSPEHESALEHAKKHLDPTYVCPMHPQVVRGEPGRCPICGMDLVAKAAEAPAAERPSRSASESVVVSVPDAVVNQLGVRTAEVRRGNLTRHVEGFGIFLRSTVQGYRASYHGPTPPSADSGASTSAMLVQGQVFERQAPLLQQGQRVRVKVPGLGAREWEGKLIGLESQINQTTHTQVFHVSVAPEVAASVPPGMSANLIVEVAPVTDALLVPRDSVIVTGRGARAMVARGEGRFEQREVEAEDFGEDEIVIRSGLTEGERVVVSAQFLLDSEANLQAGLRRLSEGELPDHAMQSASAAGAHSGDSVASDTPAQGDTAHQAPMGADMRCGAAMQGGEMKETVMPEGAMTGGSDKGAGTHGDERQEQAVPMGQRNEGGMKGATPDDAAAHEGAKQ
jgi:hypothetical protein